MYILFIYFGGEQEDGPSVYVPTLRLPTLRQTPIAERAVDDASLPRVSADEAALGDKTGSQRLVSLEA